MRNVRVQELQSQQPAPRDSGYTLTEVLVAIVLMGVAIVPIMMAGVRP